MWFPYCRRAARTSPTAKLLTSERREEAPRLFTHINLHFIVTGKELKDAAVSRAVDLSAEKYCSVALMLEKAVNITHSYEVIEG